MVRSRLHEVEAVKAIFHHWHKVARNPDSVDDFRAWLVTRKHLTQHQVDLIHAGHIDHFFLNEYRILERIGKGMTAGVYRAADPAGNVVALKVLPPSKARDPEYEARFIRESELARQLDHRSVVRTLDSGKHGHLYFLVMEHLEGQTLQSLLEERRRLPDREAARLAFLTALGLQHIHEKGMVHRDLMPDNLMLVPAPSPQENTLRSMVKIIDLGLGRLLFDPQNKEVPDWLTNEGALLGTPDYVAPEQARDARRVDIRADVYSLGCVLYHAVAGEPPFADTNLLRQILRHASQAPRPFRELELAVAPELEQIVMTMLAKDPAQRFQTPADAAEALKAFLARKSR
jgi:serine/threonine protein kinase